MKLTDYYLDEGKQIALRKQRLSLGLAGLGGIWGDVSEPESVDSILHALENNIENIDVSPSYKNAEQYLGKALRQWKGKAPNISTKVGRLKAHRSDDDLYDYSPNALKRSICQSLEQISVDKVDVILLHDPKNITDRQLPAAIETLLRFKQDGLANKVGLGGNYEPRLKPYFDNKVFDVYMGYNRLDACNLTGLNNEIQLMNQHNTEVWAASPLHMGLLGSQYHSLVNASPYWITKQDIAHAVSIKAIADRENTTMASVAIRLLAALAAVSRVVIGPSNLKELRECLTIWRDLPLGRNTVQEIIKLHNIII